MDLLIYHIVVLKGGDNMCQFKVIELNKSKYDIMVIAESYESPLESLDEVAEELRKNSYVGKRILFDSLLAIGNNDERFTEAYFGDDFVYDTFAYVKILKSDMLRNMSSLFFKNNSNYLDNSVLTKFQRELIKKGAIL